MIIEVRRGDLGYEVVINGEIIESGFFNKREAQSFIPEAERRYALNNDPDYVDFRAYKAAKAQAKFWRDLRASVGETAAPEDVITKEDYESSVAEANVNIAKYEAIMNEHLEGAKRWARECRVEL